MFEMPNPFDSAAQLPAAEATAESSPPAPPVETAVAAFDEPLKEVMSQEAPAVEPNPAVTSGALDLLGCDIGDIGEIFHFARMLCQENRDIPLFNLRLRGFDVDAFMLAVEPLPIFLQRAAE